MKKKKKLAKHTSCISCRLQKHHPFRRKARCWCSCGFRVR